MFNGCHLFYTLIFIFHKPNSSQSNGSFIVTRVYVATKSTAVLMLCHDYLVTFFYLPMAAFTIMVSL